MAGHNSIFYNLSRSQLTDHRDGVMALPQCQLISDPTEFSLLTAQQV